MHWLALHEQTPSSGLGTVSPLTEGTALEFGLTAHDRLCQVAFKQTQNIRQSHIFMLVIAGVKAGCFCQVITPSPGGPADKAGIQPRDAVLAIDGKPTAGLSLYDAGDLLQGPEGSQVWHPIQRSSFSAHQHVARAPSTTFAWPGLR